MNGNALQMVSDWRLGPVARGLAGPFSESLARVVGDREGEAAFVLASWPRQHALLAALDGPHPATPECLRATFDAGSPRDLVILGHGTAPAGLTSFFAKVGQERPPSLGGYRKLIRLLARAAVERSFCAITPTPTSIWSTFWLTSRAGLGAGRP